MSLVRVETTFRPHLHGFHFKNAFDAPLGEIAYDRDRCGTITAIIMSAGIAALAWPVKIERLCGGMCWAALDRYFHDPLIPIPPDTSPPGAGTPLFKELFERQLDSLVANGNLPAQCWDWMTRPDHGHWHDRHSIGHLTQTEEWPPIKDLLDHGIPASICMVCVRGCVSVWKNHQVVAWGYTYNESTRRVELLIYDPNYPNDDSISLGFTLGQSKSHLSARHSRGDDFRGLFYWHYDRAMIYVSTEQARPRRARDHSLDWMLLEGTHMA